MPGNAASAWTPALCTAPKNGPCAAMSAVIASAQASRVPNYAGRGVELFGAQFAEVEVDTWTGRVRVLRIAAAHDCGRVIDRLTAESQVCGGVIMGLSTALLEERVIDHDTGLVLNANLEDYKLAGTLEMPEIVPILTETYDPVNNTGVKGLGEGGAIAPPAAITNAINDALRPLGAAEILHSPATPRRILEAIEQVQQRSENVTALKNGVQAGSPLSPGNPT